MARKFYKVLDERYAGGLMDSFDAICKLEDKWGRLCTKDVLDIDYVGFHPTHNGCEVIIDDGYKSVEEVMKLLGIHGYQLVEKEPVPEIDTFFEIENGCIKALDAVEDIINLCIQYRTKKKTIFTKLERLKGTLTEISMTCAANKSSDAEHEAIDIIEKDIDKDTFVRLAYDKYVDFVLDEMAETNDIEVLSMDKDGYAFIDEVATKKAQDEAMFKIFFEGMAQKAIYDLEDVRYGNLDDPNIQSLSEAVDEVHDALQKLI